MQLTPKETFRKYSPEATKSLAVLLAEPWFHQAISATLAQMASSGGNSLQLAGANAFVATMHGMVSDEVAPRFPDHSLPSYEQTGKSAEK